MLYQFKNKTTGEVVEKIMKVSERDQYVKEHPELEQVFDSVPTVKYVGCGWEKNERNPFAKKQDALDNANREYDALQHDFEKGRGIYKKVNDEYKRQEDKMHKEAESHNIELS